MTIFKFLIFEHVHNTLVVDLTDKKSVPQLPELKKDSLFFECIFCNRCYLPTMQPSVKTYAWRKGLLPWEAWTVESRGWGVHAFKRTFCRLYQELPRSISDLRIKQENRHICQKCLLKALSNMSAPDKLHLHSIYPWSWAFFMRQRVCWGIIFASCNSSLQEAGEQLCSPEQKGFNDRLSRNGVIVESYFGRVRSLWILQSHKHRWNHYIFDQIFKFGVAFTIYMSYGIHFAIRME